MGNDRDNEIAKVRFESSLKILSYRGSPEENRKFNAALQLL